MSRSMAFVLSAAAMCVAVQPVQAQEQDLKEQAKETALEFSKALIAEDIEASMKLADAPWYMDGSVVFKNKEEVKAAFEKVFNEKDLSDGKIGEATVHEDVTKTLKAEGRQLEMLKSVIKEGDLAVLVKITTERLGEEGVVFLVRPGKDGAKVIGLVD